MGLRNPFSGRFDPVTGLLLVAEVGGNKQSTAVEDLHYYDPTWTRDVNFGWPMCEGACDNADFPTCDCMEHEQPLYHYAHNGFGHSITGGVIYRGSMFPAEYLGTIWVGDYVSGWIRVLNFNSTARTTSCKAVRVSTCSPLLTACP